MYWCAYDDAYKCQRFWCLSKHAKEEGDSCYEVMTIFFEVSMCLWWPGKTAARQKWVAEDMSLFDSSCLGFGITLPCF